MEQKEQDFLTERLLHIDLYSLLRDLFRNIWVIVVCMIIGYMWGDMYASYMATKGSSFTTETTLVVSQRGGENNIYSNSSAAQTLAGSLSNIMQSNLMQKRVCEELGKDHFTAEVSANVIDKTNLLRLVVKDRSPQEAYLVTKAIMNNYGEIATSVLGNVMVETLTEPMVPTSADKYVDHHYYAKKGLQFAILFSFLIICFLSIMNDTVKSPQDLSDKIDAKALGVIYYEQKYKTLKSRFKHKKSSILISNNTTSFSFVESYRKITAKLTYLKKAGEGLTMVITSILENEGKSTVATNLALTLAHDGSRVLLMDCDLRKPAQSLVLYDEKTPTGSLEAYLKGEQTIDEIIHYDEARKIWVIMTNKELKNASELLSGFEMEKLLAELKKNYDYIILDTPPLAGAADAETLADRADASILVVKYDTVQVPDINDEIDTLAGCRAKMAGCILNMVHRVGRGDMTSGGNYGSYYYYGNYYGKASHAGKGGE